MGHMKPIELSRRQIVITGATVGGGMALGLFVPGAAHAATPDITATY